MYHSIHLSLSKNALPQTKKSLSFANESIQMQQLRQHLWSCLLERMITILAHLFCTVLERGKKQQCSDFSIIKGQWCNCDVLQANNGAFSQ